jgi:transcriptional regulator with GAF, ATPase, and Fis domain
VREGQFREDLYYRLKTLVVTIPPLRDRGDDRPLLARHFLTCFAEQENKGNCRLSPKALDRILGYHWPGNVRELQHVIRRAVVLVDETPPETILGPELFDEVLQLEELPARPAGTGRPLPEPGENLADLVFRQLVEDKQLLEGLRQGDKSLGPLAERLLEDVLNGFQSFLQTDQAQKLLLHVKDAYFLQLVGLTPRPPGNERTFMRALRKGMRRLTHQARKALRDR